MTIPVTAGGESHCGRHKRYSPGECGVSAQKQGKHTRNPHRKKLARGKRTEKKTEEPNIIRVDHVSSTGMFAE